MLSRDAGTRPFPLPIGPRYPAKATVYRNAHVLPVREGSVLLTFAVAAGGFALPRSPAVHAMTYVVTETCIRCKYTDCVDVCPVDCFREGPNFLVIDPDECIDCTLCVAECPVEAIFAEDDVPDGQQPFKALNAELAQSMETDHRTQAGASRRRHVERRPREAPLPRALTRIRAHATPLAAQRSRLTRLTAVAPAH